MKNKWQILIVEDGSIDVEALQQFIEEQNLKIYILVYRQGSASPVFLDKQLIGGVRNERL